MNGLKLRFHSFVDLITNSSSTVYMYTTNKTEDILRDMVNNILALGGGDADFDSLFTYADAYDPYAYEAFFESFEYNYPDDTPEGLVAELDALGEKLGSDAQFSYGDYEEALQGLVTKYNLQSMFKDFANDANEGYGHSRYFYITAKDPANVEAANTLNLLKKLFSYEATYE